MGRAMEGLDAYRESNRRLWSEWTGVHEGSDFYNLESFKSGTTRDRPFDAAPGVRVRQYEVDEVGDVAGKDLLHLQCHFGIDTLSWARLGARVTGIDFAEPAIDLARRVAAETGIDARFVVSTVEDLPENLSGDFDVVYTSRGAIWWIADLRRWAEVITNFLCPGGFFYMTEFHPILMTLDEADAAEPKIRYTYFATGDALEFPVQGSYADPAVAIESTVEYGWNHDIGEIVTALAGAGLRIEFLHEMDWCDYRHIPLLREGDDGKWRLPESVTGELPLMFSIKATKIDGVERGSDV
jgi:SAM-dependent methyltransferase